MSASSLKRAVRRLRVRRCEFVNCCGDVNGCNGIYCDKARWQRMTPDEYREYFQIEPPNAADQRRADGNLESQE